MAPDQAAAWLAGLPVEALHGIRPRQAGVLHDYGIHTVVLLAAVPAETVQRLLGGRAGRQARERARGIAPPVVARSLPASASVQCTFARHTLDGADVRAALLALVVRLGRTLRRRGQSPQAPTLPLAFAWTGRWSKTCRLPQPSAHDDDLRTAAYRLMDAAGLQRGRLTGLQLRGKSCATPTPTPTPSPSRSPSTTPARPAWWPRPPSTGSGTSSAPRSSAPPQRSGPLPDPHGLTSATQGHPHRRTGNAHERGNPQAARQAIHA
ncbi:hypothetical protein ACN6LA_000837 [Streptomyces sp. SAS_269]|uniref:DinB/UmuC family translesion DNA polymerase n=1 Tax=Streptomyces sp. SAS_269 TaxID=3412749 RepID=UPI00403C5D90